MSSERILNSWKEISNYMGRGVRTLQRYERVYSLPVRRLDGKKRNSVIALPQELDLWLSRRSSPVEDRELQTLPYQREELLGQIAQLIDENTRLRCEIETLKRKAEPPALKRHASLAA